MALKSSSAVFMMLFLVGAMAITSAPKAEAQGIFGGIGGLGGIIVTQILGAIQITGLVTCTTNATVNGSAPPFPNATVLLQCGGITVAGTTTNSSGGFTITLNNERGLLSQLLSCSVVVTTPLSTCNLTLPTTGNLVSSLIPVGGSGSGTGILGGLFGGFQIINVVANLFRFVLA